MLSWDRRVAIIAILMVHAKPEGETVQAPEGDIVPTHDGRYTATSGNVGRSSVLARAGNQTGQEAWL